MTSGSTSRSREAAAVMERRIDEQRTRAARNGPAASHVKDSKSFLQPRLPETVIERDHFQRGWAAFGRQVSRGELQRGSGAKGMHAEQSSRDFSKFVVGLDLEPGTGEQVEATECLRSLGRGEGLFPFQACQGGSALDRGGPPDRDFGILVYQRQQSVGSVLLDAEWDDR